MVFSSGLWKAVPLGELESSFASGTISAIAVSFHLNMNRSSMVHMYADDYSMLFLDLGTQG